MRERRGEVKAISGQPYLLHGRTQRPQHFSIPVRFFSASRMSALIWSIPSSILSSCSVSSYEKTTLNISILSVFPTKEYIYIYIYKCLEREWTAGVKIKNSLRVRSTSLLLIEFIKKEEKNYRITLEKGERKKREKKKKQEKHNKLSHSLSRIINLFSKIEVNRHFLESSRNRDFFLVMLSITSIIFLFYINK